MLKANDFSLLVRMILTTGAVLGVLLLVARFAKKGKLDRLLNRYGAARTATRETGKPDADSCAILLRSRTAIGRDQQLMCLSWNGETLLVCVGPGGATVLSRRDDPASPGGEYDNELQPDVSTTKGVAVTDGRETFEQTLAAVGGSMNSSWFERLRDATARRDDRE